ncbi:helix-turn-helix transcriptional regulator [Cerasicoccus maritimus]|uniref:helix-turn-helix domain-containing protein n=1 Tax=Cerasicoccus maritimus TaxID=490089 RepID=UPI0031B85904
MLKRARLNNNMTQSQLSKRLDKPQSFVAKIERGERRLDVIEFISLVQAVEQSPSEFLQDYIEELNRPK